MSTPYLFEHLKSLPSATLSSLYALCPLSTRYVLSHLPLLSQILITRLSVSSGRAGNDVLNDWLKNTKANRQQERKQLRELERLGVIQPGFVRDHQCGVGLMEGQPAPVLDEAADILKLNDTFMSSFLISVTHMGSSPFYTTATAAESVETGSALPVDEKPPPAELLTRFSSSIWTSVINHLLSTTSTPTTTSSSASASAPPPPSKNMMMFIYSRKLLIPPAEEKTVMKGKRKVVVEKARPGKITDRGFGFLLEDIGGQVWSFLEYKCTKVEAIAVLICLSYCRVGRGYAIADLHPFYAPFYGGKSESGDVDVDVDVVDSRKEVMKFLTILKEFGIVFIKKEAGGLLRFYPTELGVSLLSDGGGYGGAKSATTSSLSTNAMSLNSGNQSLRIITQTNFQVIAYLSPNTRLLHLSILSLFCHNSSVIHLPNCSILQLTRDSCKGAFRSGIRSQQIVEFLEVHCHNIVTEGVEGASAVPNNIRDQLRLWEDEQHRVEILTCFKLICISNDEFDAILLWDEVGGGEEVEGEGGKEEGVRGVLWESRRDLTIYFKEDFRNAVNSFVKRKRVEQASALRTKNK